MKETQMLPVPTIARRRALLGAAALSAALLAGALPPQAAHATIGGSRNDTIGGPAAHGVAPARGHLTWHPAAVARGKRDAGR
jgi:hypothetical protein